LSRRLGGSAGQELRPCHSPRIALFQLTSDPYLVILNVVFDSHLESRWLGLQHPAGVPRMGVGRFFLDLCPSAVRQGFTFKKRKICLDMDIQLSYIETETIFDMAAWR